MGVNIYRELLVFMCVCVLSCVWLFATIWTTDLQAPLVPGIFQQEYWSALPFPTPGDFANPGIKPISLESPGLTVRFFTTSTTRENTE